ncbi:hypothetical protein JOF28_000640 [Leucobacter exalbidus]|uniref:Uncharacterized protein n=1 Tax=Leucobacter exalbidus TaxID=662960 RepID=A0A940PRF9_9MICO|nr:hypothetical protein [Leucobacter exalbidus]MBP1325408.1 hypothetical protein [Leucobacter exalbidus]
MFELGAVVPCASGALLSLALPLWFLPVTHVCRSEWWSGLPPSLLRVDPRWGEYLGEPVDHANVPVVRVEVSVVVPAH